MGLVVCQLSFGRFARSQHLARADRIIPYYAHIVMVVLLLQMKCTCFMNVQFFSHIGNTMLLQLPRKPMSLRSRPNHVQ